MPPRPSCVTTAGDCITSCIALRSFSTAAGGEPARVKMANQASITILVTPVSFTVGRAGNSGERSAVDNAYALTLAESI